MPYEVSEPTIELHKENKFYHGDLKRIIEEDGQYGAQLKWIIVLDDDGTYTDDQGIEHDRETWTWSSQKLTTHEKNKFRQYAKGLLGRDPQKGELFDERLYTSEHYKQNPTANPKELTGVDQPWRVAVMFEHGKKPDGSPKEAVRLLVSESQII